MFGISDVSSIPLRREPSEASEMMTEILFGEHFEVLETIERWAKIKTVFDHYEGWIDKKMIVELSETEFQSINDKNTFVTQNFVNRITNLATSESFLIGGGSSLPNFDFQAKTFKIGKLVFVLNEEIKIGESEIRQKIYNSAIQYLNSAYLWGGRNPMGIDCSGLTQVSYKINNVAINRDASQQVVHGTNVDFIGDAKLCDLAFFDNAEGRITHVGLVLPDNKILHASGKVRIDTLDHQGIFNEQRKIYTHKLRVIKNILDL